MKKREIEKAIKRAVNEAPTLDFEKLVSAAVVKMDEHDYITRQEVKHKPRYFKQYSAAFTFGIILLMCISGWFYQYKLPDSVIALDVNPSIELVTNKQNTVLSVKAINQDAQKVIQGHDYVNMDVNSAVKSICNSMITLGYLNNNKNDVMVSIANSDTDKADTQTKLLGSVIREDAVSKNISPHILRQVLDKDKVKANSDLAEKYNVSIGKINLITEMASSNENLSVEKLSDMSIKDLITTCKDNSIDINQIIKTDEKDLNISDSNKNNSTRETNPSENDNSNEAIPDTGNGSNSKTDTNKNDDSVTTPETNGGNTETITIPNSGSSQNSTPGADTPNPGEVGNGKNDNTNTVDGNGSVNNPNSSESGTNQNSTPDTGSGDNSTSNTTTNNTTQ